jgi:hypothetical protein
MKKTDTGTVTIVSGLPRSGTSMMMAMLEAGGMEIVVDHVRTPDIDNPRGYYEFEKVKKIGEDTSWLPETRGKVFKMVSLLLFHLPPEYEYRIVFMQRDMNEMIASQAKMLTRLDRTGNDVDEQSIRKMFTGHLVQIEKWLTDQPNIETLYVRYRDVVEDPARNAAVVAGFIEHQALNIDGMVAVVDRSLYRNRV